MARSIIDISGFDELQRKIKLLPNKVKKTEMLKILGQAATATVLAAKITAPKSKKGIHTQSGKRQYRRIEPGNLKKSIGKIRGRRGLGKANAVLYVGAKAGPSRKNDGWYAMMVHGGTVHQNPNDFMDRAYNITRGKVTNDLERRVARYIQKQINKLQTAGFN